MRTYLGLLTNAVRSALRSKHDLILENLALRQQLAVLTRQRARTRTKPADRLFWSWSTSRTTTTCDRTKRSNCGLRTTGGHGHRPGARAKSWVGRSWAGCITSTSVSPRDIRADDQEIGEARCWGGGKIVSQQRVEEAVGAVAGGAGVGGIQVDHFCRAGRDRLARVALGGVPAAADHAPVDRGREGAQARRLDPAIAAQVVTEPAWGDRVVLPRRRARRVRGVGQRHREEAADQLDRQQLPEGARRRLTRRGGREEAVDPSRLRGGEH